MTLTSKSQPGYTIFKIDSATLIPNDLRMVFLPIEKTYNKALEESLMFRVMDFKRFGLKDLSANSCVNLKKNIQLDNQLFLNYLVMKRGYDPEDPDEYNQAIKYYLDPK
jgi:hypothetical protein